MALGYDFLSLPAGDRYLVVNKEVSDEIASLTVEQIEHGKHYVRTKDVFYVDSKTGKNSILKRRLYLQKTPKKRVFLVHWHDTMTQRN